ncbi:MAG: glycosyltransferase [Tissierellia bacterium]|nr:glycosyltransferase [Tissierellia bacterium]
MRIGLFTDTYFPEINGVANSTYTLKHALERRGHEVFVFTSTTKEEVEEDHVIRIRSVDARIAKDRRIALPFLSYWKRRIKRYQLDLIHTQTEFTVGYLGRVAAIYAGIPHIHTYHTMYEDYTHYLRVPKNEKLKPVVCRLSRWFCNDADGIIVPTEKVKHRLEDYRVYRRVDVIPTGLSQEKYRRVDGDHVLALKEHYELNGTTVFLFVGRLAKEKNVDELLRYFARVPGEDLRLMIVGDGPEARRLQKIQQNLADPRVIFTGYVDWEEIQDYYALGDVFVSSSTSETQGLTYNEALAGGLKLLVRRDPCLEGVLLEGVNGYGFASSDEFVAQLPRALDLAFGGGELYSDDDFAALVEEVYRKNIRALRAG